MNACVNACMLILLCMIDNCIFACYTTMLSLLAFYFRNFMNSHVHGALSPGGLSHGSRPLRRSEAWERDSFPEQKHCVHCLLCLIAMLVILSVKDPNNASLMLKI